MCTDQLNGFAFCNRENKKLAQEWLKENEQTCVEDGYLTVKAYPVKKIVICKEALMKDMWCLVCSLGDISTQTILRLYGKRWRTETSYLDEKDLQFGFGLKNHALKTQ